MGIKKFFSKLDKTLLLLVVVVLIAVGIVLSSGGWDLALAGFKQARWLFSSVWLRLLLGFMLGGIIKVLIPKAVIARWLGHSSGVKGIIIGSYLGIFMPGGPFVFLPIIASIYSAGAGPGPVIALLVGRSMLGINPFVVWQIPFFGLELPLARYLVSIFVPPLAGMAGAFLFRVIGRFSPQAVAPGEDDTTGDGYKQAGSD